MRYTVRKAYVVPNTEYTALLSTAAHDSAGNPLSFPLKFTFRTIESTYTLTSILTDPENGSENVSLSNYQSIYVMFPKRMDQSSVEKAITVIPKSDAIFLWPMENQLKIYTGGPLMADTTYTITIDTSARDLDGVYLEQPFRAAFTTEPVQIRSTSPQNGQVFVELLPEIHIYFNTYIVASTLQRAFSIDPPASGSFTWKSNSHVYFQPQNELQPFTKYTVKIDTTMTDHWDTRLKEAYIFSFATQKR